MTFYYWGKKKEREREKDVKDIHTEPKGFSLP